jgi:mRNA interferase MazF
MDRGDIYWVDLDPTRGAEIKKLRPCIIISATPINTARHTVVVVPLSSSAKARPPIAVVISCLDRVSVAICDQIRTVDKSRLVKSAGKITLKELEILENGLRQVLSL